MLCGSPAQLDQLERKCRRIALEAGGPMAWPKAHTTWFINNVEEGVQYGLAVPGVEGVQLQVVVENVLAGQLGGLLPFASHRLATAVARLVLSGSNHLKFCTHPAQNAHHSRCRRVPKLDMKISKNLSHLGRRLEP